MEDVEGRESKRGRKNGEVEKKTGGERGDRG